MRKPQENDGKTPVFTQRQVARLLADLAIAFGRSAQRKEAEHFFEEIPASMAEFTALATDPGHLLASEFSAPVAGLSETVSLLANRAEQLAKAAGAANRKDLQQNALRISEEFCQSLSWMYRTVAFLARYHALRTPTQSDLIWEVIGDTLRSMEAIPKLFEQLEQVAGPDEFDENQTETFHLDLAEVLISLVKHFENMCERHPERFRLVARELPYWPALVTHHKAGYRKRFERITAKGLLDLGAECPLDTSARAMYRLDTPVCGLLWEEVFRDWLVVSAGVRALRREARRRNQPVDAEIEGSAIQTAEAVCCESVAERAIFRAAFALPDLCKRTASLWANQFVIPYLHLKHPDWLSLPALAKFIGKKGGDTQAEREIRRAVSAMARV